MLFAMDAFVIVSNMHHLSQHSLPVASIFKVIKERIVFNGTYLNSKFIEELLGHRDRYFDSLQWVKVSVLVILLLN